MFLKILDCMLAVVACVLAGWGAANLWRTYRLDREAGEQLEKGQLPFEIKVSGTNRTYYQTLSIQPSQTSPNS